MIDERPIRPSEEYLQQLSQQQKVAPQHTGYLKKSAGNQAKLRIQQSVAMKPEPTKREIYQRLKSANEVKYGKKRKRTQKCQVGDKTQPLKKVSRKRTVFYLQPKDRLIETEQNQTKSITKTIPQKRVATINTNNPDKAKYERLIKQMERERDQLTRERQEFEGQKLLLEFRKEIKDEEGINARPHKIKPQEKPEKRYSTKMVRSSLNQSITSAKSQRQPLSRRKDFKTDLMESKKLIENISQRILQIEESKRSPSRDDYFAGYRPTKQKFDLQNLPSILNMSVDIFNTQARQGILIHTNNKYYRQFSNREKGLKVVSQHKEGNKHITQYEDGSLITDAQKYRTIQFPDKYKLTIFRNHDVKQQMPGMVCYFSKGKQVNKITFNSEFDIYYFYKERQVQIHYRQSCRKEIRYKNGIKRVVIDPQS